MKYLMRKCISFSSWHSGPRGWGGGELRILSDGDDRIGVNQNLKKSSSTTHTKSLDQKLSLQKSHAEFPCLEIFQKGFNDISTTKRNFSDDKAGR